jgi:hypothetical protein
VPWLQNDNELQTVRAAPKFHGKPYYDSVEFRAIGSRSAKSYGFLRLLFKARDPATNTLKALACVREYEKTKGATDVLVKAGCKHLTLTSAYVIVPLENLLQRIYVVPDFVRGDGNFHVCKWKWNRSPVQDFDASG